MSDSRDRLKTIRRICERNDFLTADPYDIWKTPLGFRVKNFYNHHRVLGIPGAAFLTLFDTYLNDRVRAFYNRQEYPIVRALAAQALIQIYGATGDDSVFPAARRHLEWLQRNACEGYSGPCWGLGFPYAVSRNFHYGVNTPLTTMTPYALEAFVRYSKATGDTRYLSIIEGVFQFFENDVQVMEETEEFLATSYSASQDRTVINAVSYTMYSYALLLPYIDVSDAARIERRIHKLYRYIVMSQREDGSWPYSPEPPVFVDCFHSCIVIKNLIKTSRIIDLGDCAAVVASAYEYLKRATFVANAGLFKRFAVANKPGVVRFDLYDNSEMLNLACLMGDADLVISLERAMADVFVSGDTIYSHVDRLGLRHGRDFLRWAVMPYVYSLSTV